MQKIRLIPKILFGLLVAGVSVFGMQSSVDALEFDTSRSGDLQTVLPNEDFEISFSVDLESDTSIENTNGDRISQDGNYIDSSGYLLDGKDGDRKYPAVQVAEKYRYHYNEEAVKITVTDAKITKVGRHDIVATDNHTLTETGEDGAELSSRITLTLSASTANIVTIKIEDFTSKDDKPDGAILVPPSFFTVYVVKQQSVVVGKNTTLASGKYGVEYAYDTEDRRIDTYFKFSDKLSSPVYYSVEGSGSVYVKVSSTRRTRTTKTLWTSSEAPVHLDTNRGTSKVTAWISGNAGKTAIFIFSGPTPDTYPLIERTQGNNQTGAVGGRLEDVLEVKVTDGNRRAVSGVAVSFTSDKNSTFIPVPGTTVYAPTPNGAKEVDFVDDTVNTTIATSNRPDSNKEMWVQTDSNGLARVYYQLDKEDTGKYKVTAALQGDPLKISKTFDATAVTAGRSASLVLVSGDDQRSEADTHDVTDPLVVRVRRPGGYRISEVRVRFTALTGVLEPAPGRSAVEGPGQKDPTTSGQEIFLETDAHGEAAVVYNVGQIAGAKIVTARVDDEEKTTQYDFQIRQVEFNIDGRAPAPDPVVRPVLPVQPIVLPPSLSADISGAPGSTQTLSVTTDTAAEVSVGFSTDSFLTAGGRVLQSSFTGSRDVSIVLPNTVGTYTLTVTASTAAGGTSRDQRSIRVVEADNGGAGSQTGTLTVGIDPFSGAPGTSATVTVTATDTAGNVALNVPVTLSITAGGGSFSPATVTTGTTGTATSTLTRGSTAGTGYFVTASAIGWTFKSILIEGERVVISGTGSTQEPPGSIPTAGDPDILDIYDGDEQSGPLSVALSDPFVVEVLDANGNPLEDVRVRFRVTEGRGRLSPRTPRTDEDGFAETTFTPTSGGDLTVTATVAGLDDEVTFTVTAGDPPEALVKASGDTQHGTPGTALSDPFVVEVQDADGAGIQGIRVSFSVTAGGGSLSETSAVTAANGRAHTTLTLGSERGVNSVRASVSGVDPLTFSTSIEPKVLVAAANRPVMYWIADGMLYRLAGAKAAKIAENANGVAVDTAGGKVYWTTGSGTNGGSVQSANLDGTGVTELASIFATPMGITVDTAGSTLYWTNSRGRIQSANLNGSSIKNVHQNLSDPKDILLHGGYIYWTEGGDSIKRVNITGQKVVQDVAVGLMDIGGLAVGGGKVYWTERTGASGGTINGANLNGTQFATLATLFSAPRGIAVDTAGSTLYWTNARGRVQRGTLSAGMITNVVEGLVSPSHLAIAGANVAVAAQQPTQPAKKADTDYDVNGDGSVDNMDAGLVADALGTSTAKYDVNGDGTVNFLDLLLVFDNRDADAAAAPTVVGLQLSAVQIDRIEEQIDLLIATNDRSPAAMRTLVYLQQLLATARPEKTRLLANYPNPFNPETWMPYELATDTPVKITIYTPQGVVIRTLQLGHQSAGYYVGRDRAAYWDGRNALGERVASGLYFYQLETDTLSLLRKMVILK